VRREEERGGRRREERGERGEERGGKEHRDCFILTRRH
jgi:hypothetical protein